MKKSREIDFIRHYPAKKKELNNSYGKISQEEYVKQLKLFEAASKYEYKNQNIKIKYLANHYYFPTIIAETEKIDYINHIINVPSEVRFIEQLEEYIFPTNNVFFTI